MDESFAAVDLHLADTLLRLAGSSDEELREAIRLLSFHTRKGHVCLDLRNLPPNGPGERRHFPARFVRSLSKSNLVGMDRHRGTPLVLDGESRLYFRRMREYELRTASRLRNLALPVPVEGDRARAWSGPAPASSSGSEPLEQARRLIRERKLVVITGGPGTGKTTITAALLADLRAAWPGLRVELAAPTGKAAARLRQSLQSAFARLAEEGMVAPGELVPEVRTLHRLLGRSSISSLRRARETPLSCDLLVIDEASMVDLPLFAAMLAALPEHARLILAGDRHQLASVEAGTVLGDLCSVTEQEESEPSLFTESAELARCIIELQHNYRFGADSGIAQLAAHVRRGDAGSALAVFERSPTDLTFLREAGEARRAEIVSGFRPLGEASDALQCLAALDGFRILCAHRRGPGGVEELNMYAREVLLREGILRRVAGGIGGLEPLPILVTRNDHRLRLFNGDLGVLLHDPSGEPYVHFAAEEPGQVRRVPPERLPEHELSFATTVHKSQGSEFDRAFLQLPPEPSPVLTRELIYTAATRARGRFLVCGTDDVFRAGVAAVVSRNSGLRAALLSGTRPERGRRNY